MRKVWLLARREYLAAVRTKGFIVALVVMPLMMSGSGLGMALLKDRGSVKDQHLAIVDRSGVIGSAVVANAEARNAEVVHDPESGDKVKPAFVIELIVPDTVDPEGQLLALSDRVRSGELHAFVVVGADVLHPTPEAEDTDITYHARNAALDDTRQWVERPINNQLRRQRAIDAGVTDAELEDLFFWINAKGRGLVSIDENTGQVNAAGRADEIQAVLVPVALLMLMFAMVMMTAMPQLSAVQEEKTQRIAEVMLGSVRPFEFMMGKVLGGVGVALTGILIYVVTGALVLYRLDLEHYIPWQTLPWFFGFLALAIFLHGATFAALGAACNDPKEAQNLTFPALVPVMIPMFVLLPVLQHPDAPFATVLSFIPPITPLVMVLRLASPEEIPAWQPWLGLTLVLVWAALAVGAGGRIFRIGILMQGTPPRLGNLLRWAIRG